jgi:hypothetical protein
MERGRLDKAPPLAQSLVGHVSEFVRGYRAHHARCEALDGGAGPEDERHEIARLAKEEAALVAACARLQATCATEDEKGPAKELLVSDVASLGHAFTRLVDRVLSHEIKVYNFQCHNYIIQ